MDLGKYSLPLGIAPPSSAEEGVAQLFDALQAIKPAFVISAGRARLRASAGVTKGNAININAGQLRHADKDLNRAAVGLALETASAGEPCNYMLLQGYVSGLTGLVAGTVYYLGAAGVLLNAAPGAGLRQPIGIALSTTELLVNVSLP